VLLGQEEVMNCGVLLESWMEGALYVWKWYLVVPAQAHDWPHPMLAVNVPG
jgi:hypothetical protein